MQSGHRTLWICCLAALAGVGCDEARHEPALPKANIVVIVTDDQASSTLSYMPNAQKLLVREGTLFPNFFINDPICCPSRVTILLGQYRHNHRIERSEGGCAFRFFREGMPRKSFGALVRAAGYRTGYVGKYLNSHQAYLALHGPDDREDHLLEGWDDYHILVDASYSGFQLHENGEITDVPRSRRGYQTDVLAKLATNFIAESAASGEPFFLFVAPGAPHPPAQSAWRHRNAFEGVVAPRIPSFDEVDVSGQPALRHTRRLSMRQMVAIDMRYRKQLQALQAVDELVRDVVVELDASGQLEHTYLFFTSDNGLHFGEHRIQRGKGTPFEEAVRVPLIVRGPGVVRDRVVRQLASNVDILPTVLDLLGEPPAEGVDGRSLVSLFGPLRESPAWRNAIVLESRHEQRNQGVPGFAAVRTDRFKWIEYETGERALYDLEADPYETTNIYDSENRETAEALSLWLRELLTCHGDACRRSENAALDTPRG